MTDMILMSKKEKYMNIKQSRAYIAFFIMAITLNTYTMEQQNTYKNIGWVVLAGAAIIGGAIALNQFLTYIHSEPIEPFPFSNLPFDKQYLIITLLTQKNNATSLEKAGQTINSLAQTNQELNELINDPQFCLKLIKKLAHQFDCSDQTAAQTLRTQEAKRRLDLQRKLYNLCFSSKPSKEYFENLCEQGVDLEFGNYWQTDDTDWVSPLMCATQNDNILMIKYILEKGVKINQYNGYGITALMRAKTAMSIRLLCSMPNININQQDFDGNTALMHVIKWYHPRPIYSPFSIKIKILLAAGADPEIADNNGVTPLQAAQQTRDQEIIDLIQNAINGKI
jgi:hypothetical protein